MWGTFLVGIPQMNQGTVTIRVEEDPKGIQPIIPFNKEKLTKISKIIIFTCYYSYLPSWWS